jgi:hypothetical protein
VIFSGETLKIQSRLRSEHLPRVSEFETQPLLNRKKWVSTFLRSPNSRELRRLTDILRGSMNIWSATLRCPTAYDRAGDTASKSSIRLSVLPSFFNRFLLPFLKLEKTDLFRKLPSRKNAQASTWMFLEQTPGRRSLSGRTPDQPSIIVEHPHSCLWIG